MYTEPMVGSDLEDDEVPRPAAHSRGRTGHPPRELESLRASLAEARLTPPLFDIEDYTRSMERRPSVFTWLPL